MKKDFTNLIELVNFAKSSYNNPKAFNFLLNKEWQSISNKEFGHNVEKLTLGLKEIGLTNNKGCGIFASPSPIWLMFNFSSMALGAISVPIFPNISHENLLFEVKDAKIEFVFCSDKQNLEILLESGLNYKKIITFGFKHSKKDKNIISFEELIKIGEKSQKENPDSYQKITKKIKEDDIATIIYTSGSTGVPKGVEITHKNLVTQVNGANELFPLKYNEDVALSFLPLAHIFEGMVINFYISKGISIYFVNDVKKVGELLQTVKPTLMTVVPRMLEKTYAKMFDKAQNNSIVKKSIANLAFKLALSYNPNTQKIPLYNLFNKLVYKKLVAALGGNLKMMICGGAPLSKNLEQFFNNIGVNLYVGYGLTESSPVIATNCPRNNKIGTIGKPFPNVKVKIVKGELFTKGDSVMKGYHNDAKKTAQYIDKHGWLKTGDLAQIDDKGYIIINGRKKELFKTSGGKYVSPVPIEQKILQNCTFLSGTIIIAEGRKFVSCLLFLDFEHIDEIKTKFRLAHLSDKEFLNSEQIEQKIKDTVKNVNKSLNDWEKVRKFELIKQEISIAGGEITPSMKLKRNVLEDKFQDIIESFYK